MANVKFEANPIEGYPLQGWPRMENLSPDAAAIPPAAIWRRIEHWCGRRFVKRPITLVFEGPGYVTKQDIIWNDDGYEKMDGETGAFVAVPGPFPRNGGRQYVPAGRYRVNAVAGIDLFQCPEITYAATMFANYLAEVQKTPDGAHIAAQSYSISLGGDISESWKMKRSPVANALYDSGAANMLLPFRAKGMRFK